MNLNRSVDMLAKLLANEDITIQHGAVHTASFDIVSRTLTLPQWANSSPEVIDMLVAHEVGHALFTTAEYHQDEMKSKEFFGYLNILEDIRIEKCMKAKYPGLRKTFNVGYGMLNEQDFFGVKSLDLKDLILIDKINLYFKAGFTCGVSFTQEEKVFVHRAERTTTIQEIIELAKDMHQFTQDDIESKATVKVPGEGDEDGDDDIDDDGDEEGDYNSDGEWAKQTQKKTDKTAPVTNSQFEKKVSDLSDTSIENKYITLGDFDYDPIVPYKEVASHITQKLVEWDISTYTINGSSSRQFKLDAQPTVNYLVKEFEMKKAATLYKRAVVSKVGQLDTRKLASYKLKDDIFKRITSVPEGKNHGMLFLLDWSGSMDNCIKETVDQVINLVMFCRKAQIKFQVFAFSDNHRNHHQAWMDAEVARAEPEYAVGGNILDPNRQGLSLLEIFSSEMKSSEFNQMIEFFKSDVFYNVIRTGGTPLNEALMHMYNYAPMYKNKFNLEKLTLVTLTDGGADSTRFKNGSHISGMRYADDVEGSRKIVTVRNILVDSKTKKHYEVTADSTQFTNVLLRAIKDSLDITIIGFFLTKANARYLESAVCHNSNADNSSDVAVRLKSEMIRNGFSTLGGSGRDELFIIPLKTDIKQFTLDKVDNKLTASQIAKQFGKSFTNTKKSRILLNKFIEYIA